MLKISYTYEKSKTKAKHLVKVAFSVRYIVELVRAWLGL